MRTITKHFINGEFVESHGRDVVEVRNPKNNELIGRVTMGDAVDAERAIASAKAAFSAWSQTSLDERKAWLQKVADAVTERLDDLKALCTTEFGGLAAFSDYAMTQARDFFVLAQDTLKPESFEQTVNKAKVTHVPLGVAGLLTPWNGNPWFVCGKAASALAAGCTVVIKPSQLSALEAQVLMEAFQKAGLPAGVINVVNGRGDPVGNTITRSPDVQKISFTGSTVVGKMINRDATETMKRVTLELGGKSPTLILSDADVDGAVKFALGVGLINTGSACIAGTRILVPESRAKEFKTALKGAMEALKPGDPADPETTVQPMINELVDDPKAPFGGFKLSGFGREFGVAGMQAFTESRAVFG